MTNALIKQIFNILMWCICTMPITKDDFNKGRIENLMIRQIQSMLEANKDKAFTEEEILRIIYPEHIGWPIDRTVFNVAVMILEYLGKVEARYVADSDGAISIYFNAK